MVQRLHPVPLQRSPTALAFDARWQAPLLSFDTPEGWTVVPGERIAVARRNDAVQVGRYVRSLRWAANQRVRCRGCSVPLFQALFELDLREAPRARSAQALVDRLRPIEPIVCIVVRATDERLWVTCAHPIATDEPFRVMRLPEDC